MLDVLLESSGGMRQRRTAGAIASLLVHTSLITFAVAATMRERVVRPEDDAPIARPIFTIPAAPTPDRPRREAGTRWSISPDFPFPVIGIPSVPVIDPGASIDSVGTPVIDASGVTGSGDSSPSPGGVYSPRHVDRIVAPHSDNPQPDYPNQLRSSGLEGEVHVRFVVDSAGRVEPLSIVIVQTTHPLFGDAVRRWLPRTRYAPAEVAGRPVRQLVEQQVGFTLRR